MPRNISVNTKLQGTVDGLTYVKSARYGYHVRAAKYSKTPFTWTEPLLKSSTLLQSCNQYLKPVFRVLKPLALDGGLWSRMVSTLFASVKAGEPMGLSCLMGLDCNIQHPLREVVAGGYHFSATLEQDSLLLNVLLHDHPVDNDNLHRTAYQLRCIVIATDPTPGSDSVFMAKVLGPMTAYDAPLEPVQLQVDLPTVRGSYIVLLGIVPHTVEKGLTHIMSDFGLKVVAAG